MNVILDIETDGFNPSKIHCIVVKDIDTNVITVWDSGGDGDGSSTSNFISNLVKSLPPLHDIASNAGVDLPDYLGSMSDND